MAAGQRVRLKAASAEDLEVLAACLQDAVVRLRDMTWLAKERRFVFIGTRFQWEREPEAPLPPEAGEDASFAQGGPLYSRVHCGVAFDKVTAVKSRNLDPKRREQLLNLLTIKSDGAAIRLIFSAGVEIRLETAGLAAYLEDLGEAWPTQWRPSHALDEPPTAG
jgi:hypothetical protein